MRNSNFETSPNIRKVSTTLPKKKNILYEIQNLYMRHAWLKLLNSAQKKMQPNERAGWIIHGPGFKFQIWFWFRIQVINGPQISLQQHYCLSWEKKERYIYIYIKWTATKFKVEVKPIWMAILKDVVAGLAYLGKVFFHMKTFWTI